MTANDLAAIARAMVAPGKGILAADESFPTIKKRFSAINVESTEDTRRTYRELLFTTPGMSDFISGVILFDETLRQSSRAGVPFASILAEQGVIPGIKVDAGAKPLAGFAGETITEGLDGLRARLQEYSALGAKFAKWRAVIDIGDSIPTDFAIRANAHALARYAALCQETGVVPIVEPEVLMDGGHTLARCREVTARTLDATFAELRSHRVELSGIVLKPNMVISGKKCQQRATVQEVAAATVHCLRDHVPASVPGVAFLSGGQTSAEATAHLSAMNAMGPHPWQLSFSYGRALQDEALKAWSGKESHFKAGQAAFARRARLNSLARSGSYKPEMEAA